MDDIIKIIRLKNGDDVIASVTMLDNKVNLKNPMIFAFVGQPNTNRQYLSMNFWLPISVIKVNEIEIWDNDILAVYEPDDKFTEYYNNIIVETYSINPFDEYNPVSDNKVNSSVLLELKKANATNSIH